MEEVTLNENSALVSWSTNREASSTLHIGESAVKFDEATSFTAVVDDIDSEASTFSIIACDLDECDYKEWPLRSYYREGATIQTEDLDPPVTGVTGQVTGAASAGAVGNHLVMALFGMMALAVAAGVGFSRTRFNSTVTKTDDMENLIRKTKKHINSQEYESAKNVYMTARKTFQKLEQDKKIKNHPELVKLHGVLKRYSLIKEAQELAEKYESGTITQAEMKRLNEIMVR